ncbi:MAG: hypothetical protein K9K86_09825 [Pseudomonadales bacterium]|nr:hypothetical protein [Pseudomonadales bacterium]
MQENPTQQVTETFIVSKIEERRDQKVFLSSRMPKKGEHIFYENMLDTRALNGLRTWRFSLNDVVRACYIGSIKIGNHDTKMWLPVDVVSGVKAVVLTRAAVVISGRPYRFGEDDDLVVADFTSSVAQPGQRWECSAVEVVDGRVVWYPWRMLKAVVAEPRKDADGRVVFSVYEVSGRSKVSDAVEVEPIIETDVISRDGDSRIVRERYHYPVSTFKNGEPVLAGFVEREIKEKEGADEYSYVPADSGHFGYDGIEFLSRSDDREETEQSR